FSSWHLSLQDEVQSAYPELFGWNVGDGVNFDAEARAGKAGNLDRCASWAVLTKHSLIDCVHLLELVHVDQIHVAAQDVIQIGTGSRKDGFDVAQNLFGLTLHIRADELARRRVHAALSGNKDQTIESDAG